MGDLLNMPRIAACSCAAEMIEHQAFDQGANHFAIKDPMAWDLFLDRVIPSSAIAIAVKPTLKYPARAAPF
jgi:hypothetical protein